MLTHAIPGRIILPLGNLLCNTTQVLSQVAQYHVENHFFQSFIYKRQKYT